MRGVCNFIGSMNMKYIYIILSPNILDERIVRSKLKLKPSSSFSVFSPSIQVLRKKSGSNSVVPSRPSILAKESRGTLAHCEHLGIDTQQNAGLYSYLKL